MKVLVVAAHPDDEVLGCGGTIAKHAKKGDSVHVVFLCDGVSSREDDNQVSSNELVHRRQCAERACGLLGVECVKFADFPDNRLDSVPLLDVIKVVEKYINRFRPALVFTHNAGDLNIDHRIVNQAVVTACRPQNDSPVSTLLFYEVPSSTEWQVSSAASVFMPNWFVDISEEIDIKIDALLLYEQELRDWPHPRSVKAVKALANWRGATVSKNSAEAFMLGRQLA